MQPQTGRIQSRTLSDIDSLLMEEQWRRCDYMIFSLNRIERLASGREGRREGGRKKEMGRGREKKRERDGEGAGREVERETKGERIWKNEREMEKKDRKNEENKGTHG